MSYDNQFYRQDVISNVPKKDLSGASNSLSARAAERVAQSRVPARSAMLDGASTPTLGLTKAKITSLSIPALAEQPLVPSPMAKPAIKVISSFLYHRFTIDEIVRSGWPN